MGGGGSMQTSFILLTKINDPRYWNRNLLVHIAITKRGGAFEAAKMMDERQFDRWSVDDII